MGEPVTVYDSEGSPVVVYGKSQMESVLKAGGSKEKPEPPKRKAATKKK